MNINIPQLIEQGEGVSMEFKRAKSKLPESLFETICAFLNRNGGIIILGVTDDQIKNLYTRKNLLYSENTVYPFLFETDFVPGIVERVRKIIKINRANHPWNDLSNEEFYRTAGLYRKDFANGIEGFTMINMPIDTVDKHIRVLIKKNLIERRGSRKTGGYYLVINK